eukprot:Skav203480  [mRNA]  locus=scaffold921:331836:332201:+ [translate_table: standard]
MLLRLHPTDACNVDIVDRPLTTGDQAHHRLARGEIIIETFKAVKLSRWHTFMDSLELAPWPSVVNHQWDHHRWEADELPEGKGMAPAARLTEDKRVDFEEGDIGLAGGMVSPEEVAGFDEW